MTSAEYSAPNRAIEFIAVFNDIEAHMRKELQARPTDSFKWMVGLFLKKNWINEHQANQLRAYSDLRNAISHGRYRNGQPIAEPLPETVAEITALRGLLTDPPTAMDLLGKQDVIVMRPDESIHRALKIMRKTPISQFPVYDGKKYVALLTTNTIARWVAADLDDNDHLDARAISDVLDYAERGDHAVFLPADATGFEVIETLTTPSMRNRIPRTVILTESGDADGEPVRVIGGGDLIRLIDALELY